MSLGKKMEKLRLQHKLFFLLLVHSALPAQSAKPTISEAACMSLAHSLSKNKNMSIFEGLIKKVGMEIVEKTAWAALFCLSKKAVQSQSAYQLYLPLASSKKQLVYKMKKLKEEINGLNQEIALFKHDPLFAALLIQKKNEDNTQLNKLKTALPSTPDNDSVVENVISFLTHHVRLDIDYPKKASISFSYEA